jgi:hypothetical protein
MHNGHKKFSGACGQLIHDKSDTEVLIYINTLINSIYELKLPSNFKILSIIPHIRLRPQ